MTVRSICSGGSALVLLGMLAGCGGDSSTGPNNQTPTGGGTFTAKVDGAAWASSGLTTVAIGKAGGLYTLSGASASGTAIVLTLGPISVPGTYVLGVATGNVFGGMGIVGSGVSSWSTPLSGKAGTITVTAISSSKIAGTFSFVATPALGTSTTGNRTVTDGQFDIPLQTPGNYTPADNLGSTFGGTLNGAPWNGATVVMVAGPATGTLAGGASNVDNLINMTISGITGVGTYALNTGVARFMSVSNPTSTVRWGGTNALSSGNVVITSITSARVKGTYNATLQPAQGATGTVTLSGSFDMGIP